MHGFEERGAAGMNVSGRGEAESTSELGGEVADDVAEKIVGDDDVELAGVADEFHGEGVDEKVTGIDFGIFGADGFEDALPEIAGEGHGVGFIGHAEAEGFCSGGRGSGAHIWVGCGPGGQRCWTPTRGGDRISRRDVGAGHPRSTARNGCATGVVAGVIEGVADDALDAFAGVDIFLDGDFVGSSLSEEAAGADVDAFGVFAEDHEVDVFGGAIAEGSEAIVEEFGGAGVDVKIEFEAEAEENIGSVLIGRNARITERAKKDGVEFVAQEFYSAFGE